MKSIANFVACLLSSSRSMAILIAVIIALGNLKGAIAEHPALQKIRISSNGNDFILADSGEKFIPWGFNYLGTYSRLIEEYWGEDWPSIERDFREMRKLGANVVRIHLQFGTYMTDLNTFDQSELKRLRKMLNLSRELGMYLKITGLGCYRLDRIPDWYDALDEADRWDVQTRWWNKIAETCADHPAVFCYDLMNEPVIKEQGNQDEPRWVGGELGGFHFVQRISAGSGERTRSEIAEAWAAKLTTSIRERDPGTLITLGVIPWAMVWPTAKPLFYAPEVADHFDFVSIHAYPQTGKVDQAIAALAVYDIDKPLVVGETFPLSCTIEELDQFIDGGMNRVDGWISHYFGHTVEEHASGAEPAGAPPNTVAAFLTYWQDKGKAVARMSAERIREKAK
jgi:hypothetical protein